MIMFRRGNCVDNGGTTRVRWLGLVVLVCGSLSGCAAITNPVAEGIPVRRLPPELLAPSKNDEQTIPLPLLGQPQPDEYRVAAGDTLGIFIDTVLGDRNQTIPIHVAPQIQIRDQRRLPPAVGFPVPVRGDGSIVLPLAEPFMVNGLSLSEIEQLLRKQYTAKKILKEGNERVFVTLMVSRQYQVFVMRQEAPNFLSGSEGLVSSAKRGTGHLIDLPAYENDVLHALALSGGLPGLDAFNAVIIQRGGFRGSQDHATLRRELETLPALCGSCGQTIRIPLRQRPGQEVRFRPEDVVLQTGDVVFLEARDDELYYTAGLLPAGEHQVPRDHDLDVIEAVAQVHGPMVNGAFATNNLSGTLIASGLGGPSPSLLSVLRRTPGGGRVVIRVDLNRALRNPRESLNVQAGDILVLQEMPEEAMARYFTQAFFNFDFFWQAIHTPFGTGVVDIAAPDRLPGRVGTVNLGSP